MCTNIILGLSLVLPPNLHLFSNYRLHPYSDAELNCKNDVTELNQRIPDTTGYCACETTRDFQRPEKLKLIKHFGWVGWKKETKACLPPKISWPDVLEEKLTPSDDITGRWAPSTTSLVRKGFRFGMESSTASEEEKGSEQAKGERERIKQEDIRTRLKLTQRRLNLRWSHAKGLTSPSRGHRGSGLHAWLKVSLQVKEVALHLQGTEDQKTKQKCLNPQPIYPTEFHVDVI